MRDRTLRKIKRAVKRSLSVNPNRVVLKDRVRVIPEDEEAFVQQWINVADNVRRHEGFISMALYQDRKPREESGGFVSVLVWQSLAQLEKALTNENFLQEAPPEPGVN